MKSRINIVESQLEPNKKDLWLNDNSLKKFTKKGWKDITSSNDDYITSSEVDTKINEVKSYTDSKISPLSSSLSKLKSTKADKATTLSGYGIADAYTKSESDNLYDPKPIEIEGSMASGSLQIVLTSPVELTENDKIDLYFSNWNAVPSDVTISGMNITITFDFKFENILYVKAEIKK